MHRQSVVHRDIDLDGLTRLNIYVLDLQNWNLWLKDRLDVGESTHGILPQMFMQMLLRQRIRQLLKAIYHCRATFIPILDLIRSDLNGNVNLDRARVESGGSGL